jgi:uncharacterized protein (DUF433 family)
LEAVSWFLFIFVIQITAMNESLTERITINSDICHGKPTIRGLRYPVDSMLELMSSGMSFDELLEDYPDLEKADFLACIDYAAKLTQVKSIYRIAS